MAGFEELDKKNEARIIAICDIVDVTNTGIKTVHSPIPNKICLRAGQDGEVIAQQTQNGVSVSVGGKH